MNTPPDNPESNPAPATTRQFRCAICCALGGRPHAPGCPEGELRGQVEKAIGILETLDLSKLPLAVASAVGVLSAALDDTPAALARAAGDEVAYDEACNLAKAIYSQHYREGNETWRVLPDLRGVLGQISNMVAGLTRA